VPFGDDSYDYSLKFANILTYGVLPELDSNEWNYKSFDKLFKLFLYGIVVRN
jgi:hypothetical protein